MLKIPETSWYKVCLGVNTTHKKFQIFWTTHGKVPGILILFKLAKILKKKNQQNK